MLFNPQTKELFTDAGELIKRLHCPLKMQWEELHIINEENKYRICSACNIKIIDTRFFSDDEMVELLKNQPAACLKISSEQENVKIIL